MCSSAAIQEQLDDTQYAVHAQCTFEIASIWMLKSFTEWNGFHFKVFRPSLCEVAQTLLNRLPRVYLHRFFPSVPIEYLKSRQCISSQGIFIHLRFLRSTFIFVSFAWHGTVWMLFFYNYLTECMTFTMRTKRALELRHFKVNLLLLDASFTSHFLIKYSSKCYSQNTKVYIHLLNCEMYSKVFFRRKDEITISAKFNRIPSKCIERKTFCERWATAKYEIF